VCWIEREKREERRGELGCGGGVGVGTGGPEIEEKGEGRKKEGGG
jgi:hypothetical protein